MTKKYSVTGIGNAIIDIIILAEDSLLEEVGLVKSSMTLIDRDQTYKLLNLKYEKIRSGGSVANSIAALADFKTKTAFIGKVGRGKYGKAFSDDLAKINIDFYCKNKTEFGSTARSFVFVTPDGHRTMATYLGKASNIDDEINQQVIADSEILYLEGYLWDKDNTKVTSALKESIKIAKKNNTRIAFTLSDSFCVTRHKEDFLNLINDLDILFANEAEIKSLFSTDEINFKQIKELSKNNSNLIIVITRGEKGAIIFDNQNNQNFYEIPTKSIDKVVDTTGAGDCFAAGFLYGLTQNYSLEKSAKIGNLFAGTIIKKLGARFDEEDVAKLSKLLNTDLQKNDKTIAHY